MIKMDGNALWSPECHRWSPPENADATAKALDLLRDALRQAEARALAALAELDEAKAKLRVNEDYILALEDALEVLLDLALTVAPSSSWCEETWEGRR